jgi:hypothetical protein
VNPSRPALRRRRALIACAAAALAGGAWAGSAVNGGGDGHAGSVIALRTILGRKAATNAP